MLKIAALLFNSIALLFYQLFFMDGITITPTAPSSAKAGDEFTVEITIDKGSTSGFAKFQQDLPAGLTAVEGESNGATFTFTNQSVKLIWMSLPNDATIKVSYKVKVSAEAAGDQNITGKFSYVMDNVKQSVEVPVKKITILKTGEQAPVAVTETPGAPPSNEVTTPSVPAPTSSAMNIVCTRSVPANILSTNEFYVEVNINKRNIGGFGKLAETLPEGFTASPVDSKGGVFSFENQKVTIIWGAMPALAEYKISYKVKMDPSINGEKIIEGVFSFVENDQTLKYVLQPGIIKVVGPSESVPTPPVVEEKKEEAPPVVSKKEEAKKAPQELSASTIPAPQRSGSVNYKVQILALRKAKDVQVITNYFKLNETLSLEMAEGFTKYTVGFHQEYKAARDARENLKSANNVVGPFVTAYNNGKRITVQEALMITNQKWYN